MKYGKLLEWFDDVLNADTKMQKRIRSEANYHLFELCREVSWNMLRCDPVTLDFGAITSGRIQLPSDLYGIDLVIDEGNFIEFMPKDVPAAQLDEWGYRYYLTKTSEISFYDGDDVVVSKGGSSFVSGDLTADGRDPNGEYVTFDDTYGFYKISNSATPFTFTPAYYGDNINFKDFSIRPWETTQSLSIIDQREAELYDRSVTVYYWRAPRPLYNNSDIIPLPSVDVLKFRVLRSIPQSKTLFPVSEKMLTESFRKAVKLNPKFTRHAAPQDKHGNNFDFSNNPFEER